MNPARCINCHTADGHREGCVMSDKQDQFSVDLPHKKYEDGSQGGYWNKCIHCEQPFIGHKHDPDCGMCSIPAPAQPTEPECEHCALVKPHKCSACFFRELEPQHCVVCRTVITEADSGLCDEHKYDEQLAPQPTESELVAGLNLACHTLSHLVDSLNPAQKRLVIARIEELRSLAHRGRA